MALVDYTVAGIASITPKVLAEELADSEVLTHRCVGARVESGDLVFYFQEGAELSGAEETELDTIAAAHDPTSRRLFDAGLCKIVDETAVRRVNDTGFLYDSKRLPSTAFHVAYWGILYATRATLSYPFKVAARNNRSAATLSADTDVEDAYEALRDAVHDELALANAAKVAIIGATNELEAQANLDDYVSGDPDAVVVDNLRGHASLLEFTTSAPATGDVLIAEAAFTPVAGVSDPLVAGSVAQFDGTSWQEIVVGSGGFVPAGTRLLVTTAGAFIAGGGLTDATDEGKIAVFDGTSLSPTSFSVPVEGNRISVTSGEHAANRYVFDGTVPTGTWEEYA